MLDRARSQDILRDALAIVVVALAVQGSLFYVSEPAPLSMLAVGVIVMVAIRTAVYLRRGTMRSLADTAAGEH